VALPTLAEFQNYLGVSAVSTPPDATLMQFSLDAAAEAIAQDLNRIQIAPDLVVSPRDYIPFMDTGDTASFVCQVDEFSSTTGLVVKTDTGLDGTFATTLASTAYQAEPLNSPIYGLPFTQIRLFGMAWPISPYGRPTVRVSALWGFPVVPDAIKMAVLLQASRWYKRKDSPEGVLGSSDFGTVRITRTDPDVFAMIRPYKRYVIG
jgi:hypothetical protein